MKKSSLKDNILTREKDKIFNGLSKEKQVKINRLFDSDPDDYQLQVIKRKRIYPNIGDIFELKATDEITLKGIVINNHIDNYIDKDLIVALIFNPDKDIKECIRKGVKKDDLLVRPIILYDFYWSKGYFYNVDRYENTIKVKSYGFHEFDLVHDKDRFLDEYGNTLKRRPKLLGLFAVPTDTGVAWEVNKALIIRGDL